MPAAGQVTGNRKVMPAEAGADAEHGEQSRPP